MTVDAKRFERISGKRSADHNLDEGSILCLTVMYMDREATRDGMLLNQKGAHICRGFVPVQTNQGSWNACDVQVLVCVRASGCLERSLII